MDFFVGFFFAFPSAFLLSLCVAYFAFRRTDSTIAYDLTILKEDMANLLVKLSSKP